MTEDDRPQFYRDFFPLQPEPKPRPASPPPMVNGSGTAYAKVAFQREVETLAQTPEGSRNEQLNIAAFNLAQLVGAGHLDRLEVWEKLEDTARAIGLTDVETVRTLHSAFGAGERLPRDVPDLPPLPGLTVLDGAAGTTADEEARRHIALTAASKITVRPVQWVWDQRIAVGTLALLAGREGLGKSTVGYQIAADMSQGRLPGIYHGTPRGVVVAATEDSWEHTIVPRLMAAGADLARIYRVEVITEEHVHGSLSLPRDLVALRREMTEVEAGLLLLDPLLSRLDPKLDSHKDAEVRMALEPLTGLADTARVAVLGIIHVNKSSDTDPLTVIMGSRAFSAVARSVLFVMRDPEDDGLRLFGQPKNNLGVSDLPIKTFRIEGVTVAEHEDGPVTASRIIWEGEHAGSLYDAMRSAGEDPEVRSATAEAMHWLREYLLSQGGSALSADCKAVGFKAGHAKTTINTARARMPIRVDYVGSPPVTTWTLKDTLPTTPVPLSRPLGRVEMDTTGITGQSEPAVDTDSPTNGSDVSSAPVSQSYPVPEPPRARDNGRDQWEPEDQRLPYKDD